MITKDSRYSSLNVYSIITSSGEIRNVISERIPVAGIPITDTHRVAEGDTLEGISFKFYGTPNKWYYIADVNGIFDPDILVPGTLLNIPSPIFVGRLNG